MEVEAALPLTLLTLGLTLPPTLGLAPEAEVEVQAALPLLGLSLAPVESHISA